MPKHTITTSQGLVCEGVHLGRGDTEINEDEMQLLLKNPHFCDCLAYDNRDVEYPGEPQALLDAIGKVKATDPVHGAALEALKKVTAAAAEAANVKKGGGK